MLFTQKVDLYSLGIILFEMSYRPMTTGAERISVLSQLRVVCVLYHTARTRPFKPVSHRDSLPAAGVHHLP